MKRKWFPIITGLAVLIFSAFFIFQHVSALEDQELHALSGDGSDLSHQPQVVYLVPHADDELLSMGVDIVNHIRLRYDVHLVLMSPGGHSRARFLINGFKDSDQEPFLFKTPVYCPLHKRYHDPEKEHYQDLYLTVDDVGKARVREFKESAKLLGISDDHVHVYDLENDRFEEQEQEIRDIMDELLQRFPDAQFRTMSIDDYHPDHRMLGKVLSEFEEEGKVQGEKTLYFLSIYKTRFTKYKPSQKEYTMKLLVPQDLKKIKSAVQIYGKWDPKNGWYQIGYHSVKSQFLQLMKNAQNTYHY
ncbi:PIG-L deacetylase family protein [Thermoactinomyces sp. CICC 23799]|jgi:LmbE family N-acetylglucosaminyl deacetylase|uniref:PIG-L deacetylase family protein n=1 Tax=Thermoactinomyces sp. CICC 23799 TaxID=2767429 RepID=UPI0018DC54CB|nr:PIG-L family deacetylase [Thermoactinomyces sp. CICC 23799]MBH8600387.1 PIG-L family deacetylase [Thermoactinomyces sp. CICC 23799]